MTASPVFWRRWDPPVAVSYTHLDVYKRQTHTIEVIFMKANGNPQTGVFVDVATGSYYEDAVDCAVLFSLQETN